MMFLNMIIGKQMAKNKIAFILFGIALLAYPMLPALADPFSPSIIINTTSGTGFDSKEVYTGLKLTILLSAMVFIPSLIMAITCFPRISIVLALTRQAMGTAQTPPNQIIVGLSLFLTFAIMNSTFTQIYETAIVPYTEDQIGNEELLTRMYKPLREFMLPLTREKDINLFTEITKSEKAESPDKIKATVLIPAYIISELNTSFQMGFLIFLPFLVLDLVISAILTSMSMITLPPTVISLPIKMMLFVLIDGWGLIIGNLVKTYNLG